jgi:hypothetical protein
VRITRVVVRGESISLEGVFGLRPCFTCRYCNVACDSISCFVSGHKDHWVACDELEQNLIYQAELSRRRHAENDQG